MQTERIIQERLRDSIKKELKERYSKPYAEILIEEVSEETKHTIYNY